MASLLFEACVDSPDGAVAAHRGGASRVELCSSLLDGGVTPSMGKLAATRAVTTLPIHVLIRPRGGDFLYSASEIAELLEDVRAFVEAGVDGIVTGALQADGTMDDAVMRQVMALTAARGVPVTFHRAIDVCADALAAVTACRQLGVRYILTSGGAPTAMEGADVIRRMVEAAAAPLPAAATILPSCSSELTIIAGGGVTADTAAEVVRLSGVTQLHGTGEGTSGSSLIA
jgi:copper homeostasis protein